MGTPAQVDYGMISFETEEQAANGFEILLKWIKNVESNRCDDSLKGDYNIYEMKRTGYCINFKAESRRIQNLRWQMDNLRDAAKELEGCCEFSADLMIMDPADSVYWSKDE